MIETRERFLSRIGIFYDGNYFYHVSNYYCYGHARKSRLSIPGLHEFIKRYIALQEKTSPAFCQIVDCHYFRGRLPALEAKERQILLKHLSGFCAFANNGAAQKHKDKYAAIRKEKKLAAAEEVTSND